MIEKKVFVIVVRKLCLKDFEFGQIYFVFFFWEIIIGVLVVFVVFDILDVKNMMVCFLDKWNWYVQKSCDRMVFFVRIFLVLWLEFEKGKFWFMKVGIKEQVKVYIDVYFDCGMIFGMWIQVIWIVISCIEYQCCLKEGIFCYDIYGEFVGMVIVLEVEYVCFQVF